MTDPSLQFVATSVLYYHPSDERAFFDWLDQMSFVSSYHGVVRDLFIELNRMPTHDDLWEIIGFCRRYGIDLKQFEKFVTDDNRQWLANEIAREASSSHSS